MADFAIPTNYSTKMSPYGQRLLNQGVEDSKLYLSKPINSMLQSFTLGYHDSDILVNHHSPSETLISPHKSYEDRLDCIIDGLAVDASFIDNTLNVAIHPGNAIVDSTLITFPDTTNLNFNLNVYQDTGYIAVIIDYQWIDTVFENAPILRLLYVMPDGSYSYPDDWNFDKNRIIITTIKFEKDDSGNLTSVTNTIENPYQKVYRSWVDIKGTSVEVCPMPNLWYQLIEGMRNYFVRKLNYIITSDLWVEEVPTFPVPSGDAYFYCSIDVSGLFSDNYYIQVYLDNILITPTAIQKYSNTEVRIWMPDYFVLGEATGGDSTVDPNVVGTGGTGGTGGSDPYVPKPLNVIVLG